MQCSCFNLNFVKWCVDLPFLVNFSLELMDFSNYYIIIVVTLSLLNVVFEVKQELQKQRALQADRLTSFQFYVVYQKRSVRLLLITTMDYKGKL